MSDEEARGADPARLRGLVAARVVDAELAALAWLLLEAPVPALVVGPPGPARTAVHDALLELLPRDVRPVRLAGAAEEFDWLPEAVELGWRRERSLTAAPRGTRASPADTVLIADLDDASPAGTWGGRARVAIRALAVGYGMVATMTGDGLEEAFRRLEAPPVAASGDELSRLGLVLVLGGPPDAPERGVAADPARASRIVAAHYVRPVARDEHGHVQRLPPAVLATWDPADDRFEHFAWGIADELAARTALRPLELEREQARRAARLATGNGVRPRA